MVNATPMPVAEAPPPHPPPPHPTPQDEDLSSSLRELLREPRGRLTVAAEALALVRGWGGWQRGEEGKQAAPSRPAWRLQVGAWLVPIGLRPPSSLPARWIRCTHPQVGMAPFLLMELGTIPA